MTAAGPLRRPAGIRAVAVLSAGQTVSLLGTGMTGFAFVIWAYATTGQATTLTLAALFRFAPTVIFSPFAGALVDRWNRRLTMMLSDLAAGAATVALLLVYLAGDLQVWQWYIAGAVAGTFESFQFPAYSAAISTMVPKAQYGRASGMLSVAQTASGVFAPLLGAALYVPIGIGGIMLIDIATFSAAIGTLLFIAIPGPPPAPKGEGPARPSIWRESAFGFAYIGKRPSLLGLQLVFFLINFLFVLAAVLLPAMVLARTDGSAIALGGVEAAGAIGGVSGGLAMSLWGGPKRRIHGVLGGMALGGVFGEVLMGVGRGLFVWALAAFASFFLIPIINGSNQAIWQSKVHPGIQGKVFAARRLIAQLSAPVAMALSGPLADGFFGPAMMPGGGLVPIFGPIVGVGPGAGIALMFVLFGTIGAFVGLAGYGVRVVRDAEAILPDHDAAPPAALPPTEGPAAGLSSLGPTRGGGKEDERVR